MEKRVLGEGLEVSAVGYGCMGLTHAYGPAVDDKTAIETIRAAYDTGYTFFDTAECYTGTYADGSFAKNEDVVGKALKDVRDHVVIATKFGVKHEGNTLVVNSSPETIRKSVEGSLEHLGIDTIDLYYQHRMDPKVEPEVVAGVMKELIQEGKIKHWGISEANEEYLRRANAVCKVTAIQNRYSMMARWHEDLFPVLEELNVGYVAFSPLANGILSGVFDKNSTFAEGDYRNIMPQYTEEAFEKNKQLMKMIHNMALEKGASMAQLSMAWMTSKKPYIVPIPGTRNISRLQENAKAADIHLTQEEVKKIDDALDHLETSGVFGGSRIIK